MGSPKLNDLNLVIMMFDQNFQERHDRRVDEPDIHSLAYHRQFATEKRVLGQQNLTNNI